jgi:hypothetical protein
MLQTIITIIIVIIAVIITMIRFVRFFTSPRGNCKGCSHYNTVCTLEELKVQIKQKNNATPPES